MTPWCNSEHGRAKNHPGVVVYLCSTMNTVIHGQSEIIDDFFPTIGSNNERSKNWR
jgi:hypothetical protein